MTDYPTTRFLRPTRRLAWARSVSLREIPVDVLVVGLLIVIAAVIRIITINTQSFWADEALTAYEAHLPFGAMFHTVQNVETTPPLYFVLIWAWAHVFGTGEIALRSVSTIAGVALVPVAYLAARDLVSRRAGVVAAAFVTVNPFLIWYSQEARAYMLLALLSGASFLWFVRAQREPSRRNLTWWAVFSVLAVLTHFFAGFLIAPEALWLLWAARNRAAAVAVGVVAIAQLAVLPLAVTDTTHGPQWIAHVQPANRVSSAILEWAVSLLLRRGTKVEAFAGLAVLAVIVVALLTIAGERRTRRGAALAGGVALFVFVAPLALGVIHQDYFFSRNEIPAFVPLATAIAAACTVPRARVLGMALAVALLALFSGAALYVQTHSKFERPNWRKVAQSLGPAQVSRAILAADGTTADPLKIYLPRVNWTMSYTKPVTIREIDVVGATKRLRLRQPPPSAVGAPDKKYGRPVPRSVAPPGTRLIARFRVANWVVARFVLLHPERLTIHRLSVLAPKFFRDTPRTLLVFVQPPPGAH